MWWNQFAFRAKICKELFSSGKFDVSAWLMITCPLNITISASRFPLFLVMMWHFLFPSGLFATHVLCWLEKPPWFDGYLFIYFYSLSRVFKLVRLWAANKYSVATVVIYLHAFCKHLCLFHLSNVSPIFQWFHVDEATHRISAVRPSTIVFWFYVSMVFILSTAIVTFHYL